MYNEAQKIAIYKYREKNREKINDLAKKQYLKTKENSEAVEKRRLYAQNYYKKKKELLIEVSFNNLIDNCINEE